MAFISILLPCTSRNGSRLASGRPEVRCEAEVPAYRISRREFGLAVLPAAAAIILGDPLAAAAREKPKVPLEAALVPIVRVQESCRDLIDGIEDGTYEGTYREIKSIITTLQKGSDLKSNIKQMSLYLDPKKAEAAVEHGKVAVEYLASSVSYFNPVDLQNKPSSTFLDYVTKALGVVKKEIDQMLADVPKEYVAKARELVNGDVEDQTAS